MAYRKHKWLKKRNFLEEECGKEDQIVHKTRDLTVDVLLKKGFINKKQHYAALWFLVQTVRSRKEQQIQRRCTNTDVICKILEEGYVLRGGIERVERVGSDYARWLMICRKLIQLHPRLYNLILNVVVDNQIISRHMIKLLCSGLDIIYQEGVNVGTKGTKGSKRNIETKSFARKPFAKEEATERAPIR